MLILDPSMCIGNDATTITKSIITILRCCCCGCGCFYVVWLQCAAAAMMTTMMVFGSTAMSYYAWFFFVPFFFYKSHTNTRSRSRHIAHTVSSCYIACFVWVCARLAAAAVTTVFAIIVALVPLDGSMLDIILSNEHGSFTRTRCLFYPIFSTQATTSRSLSLYITPTFFTSLHVCMCLCECVFCSRTTTNLFQSVRAFSVI